MKTALAWFLIGFTIFFLAGVVVGWFNRTTGEAAILQVAVNHTVLRSVYPQTIFPEVWSYTCDKRIYFDYGLRSGPLVPKLESVENPIDTSHEFSFEHLETVFVAATGYELKGVLIEAAAAKGFGLTFKDKVALAVGSITGYYAGVYAVTSSYRPACDDPKVLEKLQHKEYWDRELLHSKIQHDFQVYRLVFPTRNVALVNQTDSLRRAADSLSAKEKLEFLRLLDRTDRLSTLISDWSSKGDYDLLILSERVSGDLFYFLREHDDLLAKAYTGQTAPVLGMVLPVGGWAGESNPDAEAKQMILDSGKVAGFEVAQKPLVRRTVLVVSSLILISMAVALFAVVFMVISDVRDEMRRKKRSKKVPPQEKVRSNPA